MKIDFDERRFVTIAIAASAYGGTVGFYFSAEEMREFARGFAEMLEGAPSPLGLEHGLASAAACLAARRAAQTHREETIEYGF